MSYIKVNNKPYVVADIQYKGEYRKATDSYSTEGRLAKMTRPVLYNTKKPEKNYAYTYRKCRVPEYYNINRAYGMMPR
jgi:hypothetical protein